MYYRCLFNLGLGIDEIRLEYIVDTYVTVVYQWTNTSDLHKLTFVDIVNFWSTNKM